MEKSKEQKIARAENGTIKKGTVLNPHGRPKGATNRTTKELRQIVKNYIENELETVDELLDKLTPKERLDILCKMLPYVMPKQLEVKEYEETEIIISFKD